MPQALEVDDGGTAAVFGVAGEGGKAGVCGLEGAQAVGRSARCSCYVEGKVGVEEVG